MYNKKLFVFTAKSFFRFKATMSLPNHHSDGDNLAVKDMVQQRIWALTDSDRNTKIINMFTLEVMYELEPCFKVSCNPDGSKDTSRIGDENKYTVAQRSIVADLVSIYALLIIASGANVATGEGLLPHVALSTFVKRAKADEVETEFEQFDLRKDNAAVGLGTADLINAYKKSAIRKALALGCLLDITDSFDLLIQLVGGTATPLPFISLGSNCGC